MMGRDAASRGDVGGSSPERRRHSANARPSGGIGRGVSRLAIVLAILTAGCAAMARYGPASAANDLISLLSPLLALVALLSCIGVLALAPRARTGQRPWLVMLLTLAAFFLLVDSLNATLRHPWPEPVVGAQRVRIVEFNAWGLNRSPVAASRWILAQNPDVVVLLEAAGNATFIANALRDRFPNRVTCRGVSHCSTMILSRFPPREMRGLAHGDADNRRALSAAFAQFDQGGATFSVVAVHLSQPLPIGEQTREIGSLVRQMKGISRQGMIVAGDFNSPLWSRPMRRITAQLGVTPIGGEQPTWPAEPAGKRYPPIWPIDHALLGEGWQAARATRGPVLGSDHYPLTIDLVRKDSDARP